MRNIGKGASALVIIMASTMPFAAHAKARGAETDFRVPAGDLGHALVALSRQARVQILFPQDLAARIHTNGLSGRYNLDDGLRKLLAGSGLAVASRTGDVVAVRASAEAEVPKDDPQASAQKPQAAEDIIVTARAGASPQRRIEASYAITTLSEEKLRLQAPTGLADALKNVPGIWVEGSGGETGANIRVRGIPSDGFSTIATYEDGLPVQHDGGLGWFNTDESFRLDETVKRLEVVRGGPASIFASYAPGGIVNFITRQGSDHLEGLVKLQGGDYGYGRVDAWVGAPVAGFRVGLGGFYRRDDGIRDPGYTADHGGQVRFSIGKDFGNSSIDFNVKHITDSTIFYLGIPLTGDPDGRPRGLPGIDPNFGTLNGPETSHLTFLTRKGPYNFDLTRGTHIDLTQYTNSVKLDLGDGFLLTNGTRYRDSTLHRTGLFPNSPFIDAKSAISGFLAGLPASAGATSARFVYVTSPNQTFDPANQNGNGLIIPASAREQDATLNEFINDTRLQRKFEIAGQTHDLAFGVYYAHDDETFLQRGAQVLLDVRSRARLLDLVAVNNAGNVVAHLTDGGIVRYGSQFEHGFGSSDSVAVYGSDAWQITHRLRLDLGARWEQISMRGRSEGDDLFNLGLSPTPADDNVDDGTGVFQPFRYKYHGWSATAALNYQFSDHLGVYARYTRGLRLPSLGDYITDPTNSEPRVANIQLYEGGIKAYGRNFEFYATGFYTGFNSLPFGETVFDPVTNGFISRTSFADTKTYGVELEGVLRPVKWFDVALTATLQEPRFGRFRFTDDDGPHDFTDKIQPRTPRVNLRATPGVNLLNGRVRVQGSVDYYDKRYSDAANTRALPSYTLVGADVRFDLDPKTSFYFYGTNLTNEIGLTEGNPRSGQFIAGDAGSAIYIARPELGRSFRVAVLRRF